MARDEQGNGVVQPWIETQPTRQEAVRITVGGVALDGDLAQPADGGIALFAHGSGSSRHSPRNRRVAQQLQRAGLGTLLMDLITAEEEQVDLRSRELRFDIALQLDPSMRAAGSVREIAPQADSTTRTRRVRITLDGPPESFRLGTTITATVSTVANITTSLFILLSFSWD